MLLYHATHRDSIETSRKLSGLDSFYHANHVQFVGTSSAKTQCVGYIFAIVFHQYKIYLCTTCARNTSASWGYYVLTAIFITLLYWNICLAFCYITYVCSYLLSLVCRHFFNEKGRKASFTTTKRNEGAAYLRYGLCESTYTLVLYIYYLAFKMYACRALKPFSVQQSIIMSNQKTRLKIF